jgi:choline dehydrogenase-like flavoprotein
MATFSSVFFVFAQPQKHTGLSFQTGIGPSKHLEEMGISVVQHLPAVGQHLKDHVILPVMTMSR